jgi:hypothetical protein
LISNQERKKNQTDRDRQKILKMRNFSIFSGFGDRLADIGRFSKALCSYFQAFDLAKNSDQDLGHESFVYFMQVMSKVVESNAVEFQSRKKKESNGSRQTEIFENQDQHQAGEQINQRKYYEALVGEPCNDPFSCPSCAGVLNDPVTIACGHTFCRQHVMSNTANVSLCLKVSQNFYFFKYRSRAIITRS